jgi:hypothetical protein
MEAAIAAYKATVKAAGYSLDVVYDGPEASKEDTGISTRDTANEPHLEKRLACSAITIGCLHCVASNHGALGQLACFFKWHNACIACGGGAGGCPC